jgi:hypothetical protein
MEIDADVHLRPYEDIHAECLKRRHYHTFRDFTAESIMIAGNWGINGEHI